MQVKTKIIDKSIQMQTLQYAKDGDAGIDLVATSKNYDEHGNVVYGTNRVFEIPKGYVGLLFPRSSNSKKDLLLSNSVGVLDSGYRGEVMFKYKRVYDSQKFFRVVSGMFNKYCGIELENPIKQSEIKSNYYEIGDRIGQLIIMPYPSVEFVESDDLSDTERGTGGFGHTGE